MQFQASPDEWNRITVSLKENDDLLIWIRSKQWANDRALATTVKRLLNQMKQLEHLEKIPEII